MLELHINNWHQKPRKYQHIASSSTNIKSNQPYNEHTSLLQSNTIDDCGARRKCLFPVILGSKTWIGPAGQRPLLPKSEGNGYMLSAFVSREFGFGRELTDAEVMKVNLERRSIGSTYIDTQAALEILSMTIKPVLTEALLVKYLYIGVNNEGCWNGFHMSIQFEDVVNCLQVL